MDISWKTRELIEKDKSMEGEMHTCEIPMNEDLASLACIIVIALNALPENKRKRRELFLQIMDVDHEKLIDL